MNKLRRKELEEICVKLENCVSDLEAIMEEERECYENLPEALQDSDKGEKMSDYADEIKMACDGLNDVIDNIRDEVINK